MIISPTFAGFLGFVRNVMAVPTSAITDDSVYLHYAYEVSQMIVNEQLMVVTSPSPTAGNYPTYYAIAVYNLGGDNLINYAQDLPDSPLYGNKPPLPYFADQRRNYKIGAFVGGVVASTSDNGTSVSLDVVTALKDLTIDQLENLNTPWGRRYLGLAQAAGPSIWGLS